MRCPHCAFSTPPFKTNLFGGEKAGPKIGNLSLCLECGGYSVITGPDSLRKATLSEYNEVRKAPELLLLGQIREYAYRLHSGQIRAKRAKRKK